MAPEIELAISDRVRVSPVQEAGCVLPEHRRQASLITHRTVETMMTKDIEPVLFLNKRAERHRPIA